MSDSGQVWYHALMPHRLHEIERLRPHRARRDGFQPLGDRIEARRRDLERTVKRLGPAIAAWEQVVPADLAAQTRVRSVKSGMLGVDVASSGALYEVDRLLRAGATGEITRLTGGVIRQVRLRVTSINDDIDPTPRTSA